MATPHVAGAWAVLKAAKPTATVSEVLSALQNTGTPITDTRNQIVKSLIQIGYDNMTLGALGTLLGHGNVAPSVSITSPAAGAIFVAPANITVSATAADTDGRVSKVEFFSGPTQIASISAPPFSFVWSSVPAGGYTLTARVTDTLGGTTTSGPVSITVSGNTGLNSGLVNSSFETPMLPVASYQYGPSAGSWTFSGGAGIQSNGNPWGADAAPDGQRTAFLQGTAQISQTLDLAAGSYTVSFNAARRAGQVQPIQVSIDGTSIGAPITPAGNGFAVYTTTSFTVATGGAHTLRFSSTNTTGDNSSFTDAVVVTAASASGLMNSGFETPVLPVGSYQYGPSGGSWTFSGGAGIQGNGSAWSAAVAPEGQQTAFLQGTAQISQTINLAAGSYTVSFYAARRAGQVQPIQVSIDGAPISAPITPADNIFEIYTTSSFNVATGGAHTLRFSGTANGDNSSFIDAVVVAAAPPPAGLVNSGFETPVLPLSSYHYAPAGGTWTFSSGAGIQSNGSAWGAAAAPERQQTAFLQGTAQMSQTLNLAAGNYTVSFHAARRGGQIQPIQISIDGTPIGGPITPADNSFAVYTTSAFNLATGGAHTLRFSSTNTGDNSSFIDAVVVAAAGVNNPPSVSLVSVATGFSAPVDIANARDSSGRLFVVQQGGQIRIISGGQVLPAPFLDIQSLVLSGGERGLLGVAFHTNYAVNGFFYVNYTAAAPRPVNSGLETPVLPPSSYQYAPTGGTWTFSSGAGIQSNGSAWGAAAAPEGQQTAFLQGIAQMSQTLNLAAGNYTVSFYAARRGGQIQPIQVSIDGTPIGGPITPADNSFAVYTTSAFNLATGGAHTLRFNSTNTGDNSSFVDAVVVVPEEGDGATVIARYQRSAGDPNIADPNSAQILLTVAQPFANHNGGQLRFGADGYLYIGLGDGGSGNDPGDRAQNLNTLLGKMLRIDVNSGSPYAIPEGNPFQNDGNPNTRGEIWAYGLRNPWRFSFDRLTGDLFIADVGQSAREEINFQQAGSGAGANYGWRVMEGSNCTGLGGTGPACFAPSLTPPILEYDHSVGCSVTGGHRYRGAAYPTLTGYFVYGDFCTQRIWGATTSGNGVWSNTQLSVTAFKISTFGEDETGEIYVAGYDTGVIYRVAAQ